MKVRKNIKKLTPDEKKRYVNAVLGLKAQDSVIHPGSQSRYDDFAECHMNAMSVMPGWAHQGSVFFPWHRELLYQFEKLLQAVDPSVTIPYWDWTRDKQPANTGFPFVNNFLARDGNNVVNQQRVVRDPAAPPVTVGNPYIYPFDPELWSIVHKDSPGDASFLQRNFGSRTDATQLPNNDTSINNQTGTFFREAIGENTYLALRADAEDLHNLVHRYVGGILGNNPAGDAGGTMYKMTSPNDPVFFMHHAQIDRMWSFWQKKVAPGTAFYVQSINVQGHRLNDAMLFNDNDPAPFTTGTTIAQVIDGHAMHGDGVWYDSDIPEVDAPLPSLDFINIPEGLTSYKAVRFKIKGGRPVKFRITGDPTGQFGITTMGRDFVANPVDVDDFYYGYVWVQLNAIAGAIPNSSVAIHVYFNDEEGYYAANEGDEVPIADYTVTLTATTVPRENNSIALVLDRSGSMIEPAGGTSTRSQLLQNAIEVFRTLMLPNDEVAVVTFDDVVAAAIAMQTVSGAPSFNTVDLTPRNMTWIGGGIVQGNVELTTAAHTNKAMIVLTDGNENIHPYVGELPAGTITNRTFAIGFGLPGEVSDPVLNQITSNTNGDLIITGNMPSEEQRFNLTKYFVQILAGVMNSQVILDPNGKLFFGTQDVIPFKVSDTDVYVDAITLCPIPQFVDFILETPGGKLIKPSIVEPNIIFINGQQVLCYRMVLPAISADPTGTHAGLWKAVLSIKSRDQIGKLLENKKFVNRTLSPSVNAYLPYSFLVHSTSNLQFKCWRMQDSFVPGATVKIFAAITEYDVPLIQRASVWAEVLRPDGSGFDIKLNQNANGNYEESFATTMAGLYTFKIKAEGNTSKGYSFTREKTLTAGVYYGKYDPVPPTAPGELFCEIIHCMLEEHPVFTKDAYKKMASLGIDLKQLIKCLKEVCPENTSEIPTDIIKKLMQRMKKNEQAITKVKLAQGNAPKKVRKDTSKPFRKMSEKEIEEMARTMFLPLDLKKERTKTDDSGQGHGHDHSGMNVKKGRKKNKP